jgi:hypothetical protein
MGERSKNPLPMGEDCAATRQDLHDALLSALQDLLRHSGDEGLFAEVNVEGGTPMYLAFGKPEDIRNFIALVADSGTARLPSVH